MRILTTEEEIAEYRKQFAGIEAPDLLEIVEYKPRGVGSISGSDTHRIEGWWCPAARPKLPEPATVQDLIAAAIIDKILKEEEQEERAGLAFSTRMPRQTIRLRHCTREEATHVSMYAVCGYTARIDDPYLRRLGRYVNWKPEHMVEHREQHQRFIDQDLYLNSPIEVTVQVQRT